MISTVCRPASVRVLRLQHKLMSKSGSRLNNAVVLKYLNLGPKLFPKFSKTIIKMKKKKCRQELLYKPTSRPIINNTINNFNDYLDIDNKNL